MNEQPNARITKIVAKMIQAIHGRPRQMLNALSAADAEQAFAEAAEIDRNEEMKRGIDLKANERYFGAEDLRKNYANAEPDLTKAMAQVHDKPHRVAGYRRAETGTSLGGVISKMPRNEAFEKAIISKFKKND